MLIGWRYIEFQGLWRYIKDWQEVFRHFDRDHSGSIDGHELASALNSFGYKLSPQLLSLVEQKYGECGFGATMRAFHCEGGGYLSSPL